MKPAIVTVVIIVAAFVAISLQVIPGGRVGVSERDGDIQLVEPGLHLGLPWTRVKVYPVAPVEVDITTAAETPGGTLTAEMLLEISLQRDQVASLHRSYRGDYVDALVTPLMGEYLRRNLIAERAHSPETEHPAIEKGIQALLNSSLASYGIRIHSVSLKSLDLAVNEQDVEAIELAERFGGKVVLIGCDAFDWQIYEEVSKSAPTPNIERLTREGATGDLVSMQPLVSPMIWTSMATGVEPHIHGIIDFLMKDPSTGDNVPITSSMRKVPALWNILTRYGLSSGFIGWLGTYPAESVQGFMVSDRIVFHAFDPRWVRGEAEDGGPEPDVTGLAYPESLIYEIRPLILSSDDIPYEALRQYIDIAPDELMAGATTFDPLDPVRNLRLIVASNMTYERIADYIYEKYRPDLFSVYLDLVDNVCHLFIKHMEPHTADVSARDARKYGDAIAASYAHTDSLVGEWLNLIDDETTLILVSDHGFKSGDIRPAGPSAIGRGQAVNWHRMTGAIALYGNRIRKGAEIADAHIMDVAPTILRLLGLPKAKDMPGRVLEDAFEEGWLASSSQIAEIETYGGRLEVSQAVRREDEEEAILERLRALGYVGGTATDLSKLASSFFNRAQFDEAIEIWNQMLAQDPGNVDIMTRIGNALIQKGDLEGALSVLKDATRRDPDFLGAQSMLAICYINLNRVDEAADIVRDVLAQDPRNAEAYFTLGVISGKKGLYDDALYAFRRSVELRSDYADSRINLANEYIRRGDYRQAKTHLWKAVELNPLNYHAWYTLGKVFQGALDSDSAMICFRETLKLAPGYNPARISMSAVLASGGMLDEAKRELESGLRYPHQLNLVHINLGIVNRELGDLESAEEHFKEAIEIDRYYLPARFDLVSLYIAKGDNLEARKQLAEILEVDPANDRARNLAETLR